MKKIKPSRVILYAILIVYAVITVYPFLWALFASIKPYSEIVGSGLSLLPSKPTLDNFNYIFTQDPLFPKWVVN